MMKRSWNKFVLFQVYLGGKRSQNNPPKKMPVFKALSGSVQPSNPATVTSEAPTGFKVLYIYITSWWLNQPHWKILFKIGSFPQVGVKIKNDWNHHLDKISIYPSICLSVYLSVCLSVDLRCFKQSRFLFENMLLSFGAGTWMSLHHLGWIDLEDVAFRKIRPEITCHLHSSTFGTKGRFFGL